MIVSDQDIAGQPRSIELEVAFDMGTTVYRRAGGDVAGIVTGYLVRPSAIVYWITWGDTRVETGHFSIELDDEKPL